MRTPRADPKNVASIILGGGAGTRLFPLTRGRAKPAVPIGGCYRLIDIPMSNCINSGIRKIFILTQFNSFSLNRHLSRTYNFGNGVNFGDGFVEVRYHCPPAPSYIFIYVDFSLEVLPPLGMIRFLLQLKLLEMQERNGFRVLLMLLGSLYGSLRYSLILFVSLHSH